MTTAIISQGVFTSSPTAVVSDAKIVNRGSIGHAGKRRSLGALNRLMSEGRKSLLAKAEKNTIALTGKPRF